MAATPATCAVCNKTVYHAEGVRLDGQTWHKACFNCSECKKKLTLQNYFKSPHTKHSGLIFCGKCGPVHTPKVSMDSVDARRAAAHKGGMLHNDQVRNIGTVGRAGRSRPHNYFAAKHAGQEVEDDGDTDEEDEDTDEEEYDFTSSSASATPKLPPPEIPARSAASVSPIRQGTEPTGYHDSGYPIYGNMTGYYAKLDSDAGGEAEEGGASYATSAIIPHPGGGGGGAADRAGMALSEEGTYDNPGQTPRGETDTAANKRQSLIFDDEDGFNGFDDVDTAAAMKGGQRRASLTNISQAYRFDLESGMVAPTNPFGERLDLPEDHDAPHPDALSDPDYGQPCLTCSSTCPGFLQHKWRKKCLNCGCPRANHRSKEITARRHAMTGTVRGGWKMKYSWTPAGCDEALATDYFGCIPTECVPKVGSDGEIWRHQQLEVQLPKHDTDITQCADLSAAEAVAFKKLDEVRLTTIFDVGEVIRCPDFSKPDGCPECQLKEDGTHWAYCTRFVEPDPVKRMLMAGIKIKGTQRKASVKSSPKRQSVHLMTEEEFFVENDIKSMKKGAKKKTMKKKTVVSFAEAEPEDAGADEPDPHAVPEELALERIPSGGKCHGCRTVLFTGEPVVAVGRFDNDTETHFHPWCFTCSECGEILVDLRACVDYGKEEVGVEGAEKRLFCGRHWADNRLSRCSGCDEMILQREQVYECGKPYHVRHFSCTICDANLTQLDTFVPRGRKPYCFPCFGAHFADKCVACRLPINPMPGHGGKVSVKGNHWHGTCFVCKVCSKPLDGKPCIPRDDGVYCKPCLKQVIREQRGR